MWSIMQNCSGTNLLPTPLKHSEEIKHAANSGRSVYELSGPVGAPSSYKACIANLDVVFGDVELAIRKTWPSHSRDLQKLGMVVDKAAA
jgi:chromosome partitioning protein